MESEAGEILLILGGTALIVFYGIRARQERKRLARHPPKGSPAYRAQVRRAFEAEFGLEPGTLDKEEWEEAFGGFLPPENDAFGSVICPECGERYRAGIAFCELCGAPTADDEDGPDPSREQDRLHAPLVCIFATTDTVEAAVVRSLLESHDIPTALNGPVALNVHIFHRIDAATIKLMVLEPDAERARRIIAAAH